MRNVFVVYVKEPYLLSESVMMLLMMMMMIVIMVYGVGLCFMNCHKISPPSSRASSRPQTVRTRTGSSPGLDTNQIHNILNKKNTSSFASLLCKNSDSVDDNDSLPPTRSMSVISVTSVLSPSSIDTSTASSMPRFIKVTPARDPPDLLSLSTAATTSTMTATTTTTTTTTTTMMMATTSATTSTTTSTMTTTPSTMLISSTKNAFDDEVKKTMTTTIPMRVLYIDEIVWKIDDVVYAAGIDAATNMSLLCRLNIEFVCEIVDESSEHIQQSRRQTRGFDCPCLCPRQLNHFRYFVSMDVPETEQKCIQNKTNMHILFDQFIELVARGRKVGKSVLVCSTRGRNRAPAFCAAYLMAHERMSRGKAVSKVCRQMGTMRPPVNISDFMQRALMRYQASIGVEPEAAYDSAHSIQLFHVKRSAWT